MDRDRDDWLRAVGEVLAGVPGLVDVEDRWLGVGRRLILSDLSTCAPFIERAAAAASSPTSASLAKRRRTSLARVLPRSRRSSTTPRRRSNSRWNRDAAAAGCSRVQISASTPGGGIEPSTPPLMTSGPRRPGLSTRLKAYEQARDDVTMLPENVRPGGARARQCRLLLRLQAA